MENIIKIFANEEFGRVRTVIIKGEPWFVLADVCKALEISNSRMVASRLDSDELMSVKLTSGGQRREMIPILRVKCKSCLAIFVLYLLIIT